MLIWNRCISRSLVFILVLVVSRNDSERVGSCSRAWRQIRCIDHHVELYFSPPTLEPRSLCLSTEHDTHVGNPKGFWKGQTVDTHYVVPRTNKTHTHTYICINKTLIPPFKARPVRLVVQAWGEETFAVLERLCRSGLFSLLCCLHALWVSPSSSLIDFIPPDTSVAFTEEERRRTISLRLSVQASLPLAGAPPALPPPPHPGIQSLEISRMDAVLSASTLMHMEIVAQGGQRQYQEPSWCSIRQSLSASFSQHSLLLFFHCKQKSSNCVPLAFKQAQMKLVNWLNIFRADFGI